MKMANELSTIISRIAMYFNTRFVIAYAKKQFFQQFTTVLDIEQ